MVAGLSGLAKIFRVGPRAYLRQLNRIGDTKIGTLKGTDQFGNKYYENDQDEIIMRTRWVEYSGWYFRMDQLEPGWRSWLVYTVDTPPSELKPLQKAIQAFPKVGPAQIQAYTGTSKNYVPYSTVRPRVESWTWQPKVAERS